MFNVFQKHVNLLPIGRLFTLYCIKTPNLCILSHKCENLLLNSKNVITETDVAIFLGLAN